MFNNLDEISNVHSDLSIISNQKSNDESSEISSITNQDQKELVTKNQNRTEMQKKLNTKVEGENTFDKPILKDDSNFNGMIEEETRKIEINLHENLDGSRNFQKKKEPVNIKNVLEKAEVLIKKTSYESSTGKAEIIKDFLSFKETWNRYVKSGNKISSIMKDNFNSIQKIHEKPFVGIQCENHEGIKLLYRDNLVKQLERFDDEVKNNKRLCELYERYLETLCGVEIPSKRKGIAREKGLNRLFIQINVSEVEKTRENLYIKNSRASRNKIGSPQFNPWGYNYRIFLPKEHSTAFNLINLMMEEVQIEKNLFHNMIEKIRETIPDSTGNYGFPTKAYRFKYSTAELDEILRYVFFRSIQGRRLSRCGENVRRLIDYHENNGTKISRLIVSFQKISENLSFDIYYLDKSKSLKDIIKEIKIELKEKGYYKTRSKEGIDTESRIFWKRAKKEISFHRITEIFQKAELKNVFSLGTSYNIKQVIDSGLGSVTSNPKRFWNENFANSFTRVISAMMGDPFVRKRFNNHIRLKFYENVGIIEVGHAHHVNILTKPDAIYYQINPYQKKGGALDSVQIKKMSKLGQNRGELEYLDYMLDMIKTFSYCDTNQFPSRLRNLQVYVIQKGDNCNHLTDIAMRNNIAIIAFWGTSDPVSNRINDIISGMRLENYTKDGTCRNRNVNELLHAIKLRMNEGGEILNGTQLDTIAPSKIHEIIYKLKSRTLYSFLHESIFIILESFHKSFISSNNIDREN